MNWNKETLEKLKDLMDQKLTNMEGQKKVCETLRGTTIIHLKLIEEGIDHEKLRDMVPGTKFGDMYYRQGMPFDCLYYEGRKIRLSEKVPYSSYTLKVINENQPQT